MISCVETGNVSYFITFATSKESPCFKTFPHFLYPHRSIFNGFVEVTIRIVVLMASASLAHQVSVIIELRICVVSFKEAFLVHCAWIQSVFHLGIEEKGLVDLGRAEAVVLMGCPDRQDHHRCPNPTSQN